MSIDSPERVADTAEHQTETRPPLTLVKDHQGPVEGTVVEHQDEKPAPPAWVHSGKALAARSRTHATGHHLYLPWVGRGYRELGRRWLEARRDDYPQMIASAKAELKAAKGDTSAEASAKQRVKTLRQEYRLHKRWHWIKTGGWGAAGSGACTTAVVVGGGWIDLALAAGALVTGALYGRPEGTQPVVATGEVVDVETDAPPPEPLDEEALKLALRAIGLPEGAKVLASTWGEDGASTTVVDLPPGVTVTMLQKKLEAFAGALGRDTSMVDVTKHGAAGRASIWMTDADPFAAPRPSPLLGTSGSIDAFKDGVPVAWNKRGHTVRLPVNNASFVIAGMTRSGKGVGAANLVAGAAMDPRINLRIVAGKTNGEWDAYARAGVAATYFKPDAERLLALLKALNADMHRRNRILGDLGKSKMTPETILRLGGIELLVIDELATYTRPGNPLRDETLKELTDLSAVAAGAGILLVLITQYPEVDVIPQGLAMNCGTRWAMRVDNATQSNAVLGGGASSSGRDASKFDPPLPGLGWLVNPFAGVTDKARSYDLDEDERQEITALMERAAGLREAAGRLVGQWDDPIERALAGATAGMSSAAGGPKRNGEPGRMAAFLTDEQRQQLAAVRGALEAMKRLGREAAQLDEMAELIGDGMTGDRLGELLRAAGAGGTVKITIPERSSRVNGYRAADIRDAVRFLEEA